MVPVPMDYGVLKPASVNDLFTEAGGFVPPGSTFKMPFVYTLFWVPQDTPPAAARRNTCPAVLLAGVLGIATYWFMDRWDAHLVDIIVASFISTGVIA
ncbi:hypothetical protein B0H10DRAFT_2145811 [Mycena sp. CBHHK59/15]|nr:hypothetical protein B0H10DRAFT_2145811 [Mycena sp. CBHHK59/15]